LLGRDFARSPKGQVVNDFRASSRGTNQTLISAIDARGVVAELQLSGAVDGDVFLSFIQNQLAPQLNKGDIVILDNYSIHKVKGVAEVVEAQGAAIFYLPPYSPDLNPIELYWAILKQKVKSYAAKTKEQFFEALKQSIESIQEIVFENLFKHLFKCLELIK
jgi:transposase